MFHSIASKSLFNRDAVNLDLDIEEQNTIFYSISVFRREIMTLSCSRSSQISEWSSKWAHVRIVMIEIRTLYSYKTNLMTVALN